MYTTGAGWVGNVLGAQVKIRHKMPWFSRAGAKGTVTMIIGNRKVQILVTGNVNVLEGVAVMGRMLYTPRTNATALLFR